MRGKGIICLLLAAVLAAPMPAQAGNFVDDAITQKRVTQPGSFVGQKRGYLTGGGVSARWPSTNDYLLSVDPPRFKAGCGGIDINFGGVSYLKFEYLVKKLQRIGLSALMAYVVANEVLSATVSKIQQYGDSAANWSNGLSLDDCKASEKVVAVLKDPGAAVADAKRSMASVEQRMKSGGSDNYSDAQSGAANASGQFNTPDTAAGGALEQCPPDLNTVFLQPNTSILANMSAKFSYAGSAYVDLMRGFVGDILVVAPGGQTDYRLINPCPQNSAVNIASFIDGEAYAMPASGDPAQCALTPDANRNLYNWAKLQVDAVISAMKAGGNYTATQEQFLAESGAYNDIMLAAAAGTDDEVAVDIAGMTARRYAYWIMQSLYERTDAMISRAQQIMASTHDQTGCKVEIVVVNADKLEALRDRVGQVSKGLRAEYQRQDAEYANRIATRMNMMKQAREVVYKDMSKTYNRALARKVAGGVM